jgi:hypothetical protein
MKRNVILVFTLFFIAFTFSACGNESSIDLEGNDSQSFNERLESANANINAFTSLPDWALDIGLKDYEDLIIDQKNSSIVEANGVMPDSFDVIYTGEISLLLEEAKELISQYSMQVTLDDSVNSILLAEGKTTDSKYNISVYVDGKTFELSAVNLEQMDEFNR